MVQPPINQRKNLARSLRKGGYSYTEIQKFVNVPKATLAQWVKDVELSEAQQARLDKKRTDATKVGTQRRSENISRTIEQIQRSAVNEIGTLSKRELWLMGIMLYWRNKNKNDVRKGVSFTSSDPHLIRLFLKWLQDVGHIERDEIVFDVFLGVKKSNKKKATEDALTFWSIETGFPQANFANIYYYKKPSSSIVRVRVRASSMLARQIQGWIEGLKELLK
jgi:hypothetical protein